MVAIWNLCSKQAKSICSGICEKFQIKCVYNGFVCEVAALDYGSMNTIISPSLVLKFLSSARALVILDRGSQVNVYELLLQWCKCFEA